MSLASRLRNVELIAHRHLEKSGRSPSDFKLLLVSKSRTAEEIRQVIPLGYKLFGENYVQEALEKQGELSDQPLVWHFIGSLQSKKSSQVVGRFDLIHSLDRLSLAQKLDQAAQNKGLKQKVLLQVNLSGEKTKSGVEADQLEVLVDQLVNLQNLQLCGLMTMPPLSSNPEDSRPYFVRLRENLEKVRKQVAEPDVFKELSMGTSEDFGVAIEEGATIVRVGRKVFGPRD